MAAKVLVIPIFIPHLGCPHTCVFCNQRKIAGNYNCPTGQDIMAIADKFISNTKNSNTIHTEIAFYGGSFTGIDSVLQEELLAAVQDLLARKKIHGIRLSTRPDYINEQVLKRLKKYHVSTVELGVQSLDQDVLKESKRGHKAEDVKIAVRLLQKAGIKVGIQLMPGLPGDSFSKVIMTTKEVIKLKPDFVRIYPTVVIKGTELSQMLDDGEYTPWSLEDAVEISANMHILFSREGIPIIRMGLQKTENLTWGKDLIAGPYHPAFGELVKGKIFQKQTEMLLTEMNLIRKGTTVHLKCNERDISQIKGQKQRNLSYFKEKYDIFLNILVDPLVLPGSIKVEISREKDPIVFSRRDFLDKYRIK